MLRSKQITAAAILLFLLSLMNAASELPLLIQGPAAAASRSDVGPYALSVFNFTYSIAGVIAAFGLWRNKRWGKFLALIVAALSVLNLLIPIITNQIPLPIMVMAGVFTALYVLVVVLVLRNGSPSVESNL